MPSSVNRWRWPFNHPSHVERTVYYCLSRIHSRTAFQFFFFFQIACIVHRNKQDKLLREERGFERFLIKSRRKTGIRSLDPVVIYCYMLKQTKWLQLSSPSWKQKKYLPSPGFEPGTPTTILSIRRSRPLCYDPALRPGMSIMLQILNSNLGNMKKIRCKALFLS